MPRWRIDPARASISSALKCLRGLRGLGRRNATGILRCAGLRSGAGSSSSPMRAAAASEPGTGRLLRHDACPLLSTSVRQHGPHHRPFPTEAQAHPNTKRPVRPARATRHEPALLIIEGAWAGLCRRRDLGGRGVRRRNRLGPITQRKGLLAFIETRRRNSFDGAAHTLGR